MPVLRLLGADDSVGDGECCGRFEVRQLGRVRAGDKDLREFLEQMEEGGATGAVEFADDVVDQDDGSVILVGEYAGGGEPDEDGCQSALTFGADVGNWAAIQ